MVHRGVYASDGTILHGIYNLESRQAMIIAALSQFGTTSYAIWEFAGGVLVVMFTVALILMGVSLIKGLIE